MIPRGFAFCSVLLMLSPALAARPAEPPVTKADVAGKTYMGPFTKANRFQGIWIRFGDAKHVTLNKYEFAFLAVLPNDTISGRATIDFGDASRPIELEDFGYGTMSRNSRTVFIRSANHGKKDAPDSTWRLERVDPPAAHHPGDGKCAGLPEIAGARSAERTLGSLAIATIVDLDLALAGFERQDRPAQMNPFSRVLSRTGNVIEQARRPAPPRPAAAPQRAAVPPQFDPAEQDRVQFELILKELELVKAERASLQTQLGEAEARVQSAKQEAARLTKLRRAHRYTVMPVDDLLRSGMVERHRSLFRTSYRLTALPSDPFEPVPDDREFIIRYPLRRLTVLSPHPRQSYDLVPISFEQTKLKIHDPESFWTMPDLVIAVQ
jgi:hypothetical protein